MKNFIRTIPEIAFTNIYFPFSSCVRPNDTRTAIRLPKGRKERECMYVEIRRKKNTIKVIYIDLIEFCLKRKEKII